MAARRVGTAGVNLGDAFGRTIEERDPVCADKPVFASPTGLVRPAVVNQRPSGCDRAAFGEMLRDAAGELTPGLDVDPEPWRAGRGEAEGGDDAAPGVSAGRVVGEGTDEGDRVHEDPFAGSGLLCCLLCANGTRESELVSSRSSTFFVDGSVPGWWVWW
jgi:hypothetical protein